MTFRYMKHYVKRDTADDTNSEGGTPAGFEPGDPAEVEAAALAAAQAAAKGKPNPDPNAPKKTTVKFGDQEFEVDANLAAALTAFQTNLEAEFRTQQQPTPPKTPAKKDEPYDYEVGLFTEPAVAVAKLREEILAQVRGEYAAVKDTEAFWTTFYAENKDLKELDFLVESVMNKNWAKIKDLPAERGMKELAKLSREAATKLGRPAVKDDSKNTNNRQMTEGASTPGVKIPVQPQNTQVTSLSEIVRQRQAAKRNGGKAA